MNNYLDNRYWVKQRRDIFIILTVVSLVLRFILVIVGLSQDWLILGLIGIFVIPLVNIALALFATYYWAVYKGRDTLWLLLGIAVPLGWIIMAVLEDKWIEKPGRNGTGYYSDYLKQPDGE